VRLALAESVRSWILSEGTSEAALLERPLSIGRLPECDLSLAGENVSRRHAYLLPTPEGPMLVDRSQFGTWVNGERMTVPRLLADGDSLEIGGHTITVKAVSRSRASEAVPAGGALRLRRWVVRYGPSELLGTIVTVGAATSMFALTGSTVAAAFAGTLAEVVVYYGVMILRETIREAYEAGRRHAPYGTVQVIGVIRNVVMEFGIAEALDSGVIRPFCLSMGLTLVGGQAGVLVGKLAADLVFYGPVLAAYEWRLARAQSERQTAQEGRRHRPTGQMLREEEG